MMAVTGAKISSTLTIQPHGTNGGVLNGARTLLIKYLGHATPGSAPIIRRISSQMGTVILLSHAASAGRLDYTRDDTHKVFNGLCT